MEYILDGSYLCYEVSPQALNKEAFEQVKNCIDLAVDRYVNTYVLSLRLLLPDSNITGVSAVRFVLDNLSKLINGYSNGRLVKPEDAPFIFFMSKMDCEIHLLLLFDHAFVADSRSYGLAALPEYINQLWIQSLHIAGYFVQEKSLVRVDSDISVALYKRSQFFLSDYEALIRDISPIASACKDYYLGVR